jgi:hypothetical protein
LIHNLIVQSLKKSLINDFCDWEDFHNAVRLMAKLIKAHLSVTCHNHTFIVDVVDFDCQGACGIEISQLTGRKNPELAQRELLNAEEAASVYCVSTTFIYNLFDIRDVPSVTPQYSKIFFKRADLEEHFKQVRIVSVEGAEPRASIFMPHRRIVQREWSAGSVQVINK